MIKRTLGRLSALVEGDTKTAAVLRAYRQQPTHEAAAQLAAAFVRDPDSEINQQLLEIPAVAAQIRAQVAATKDTSMRTFPLRVTLIRNDPRAAAQAGVQHRIVTKIGGYEVSTAYISPVLAPGLSSWEFETMVFKVDADGDREEITSKGTDDIEHAMYDHQAMERYVQQRIRAGAEAVKKKVRRRLNDRKKTTVLRSTPEERARQRSKKRKEKRRRGK